MSSVFMLTFSLEFRKFMLWSILSPYMLGFCCGESGGFDYEGILGGDFTITGTEETTTNGGSFFSVGFCLVSDVGFDGFEAYF